MDNIAALKLTIQSDGAEKAGRDLDLLIERSGQAEANAAEMERAFEALSKTLAQALSPEEIKKFTATLNEQSDGIMSVKKSTQELNSVVKAGTEAHKEASSEIKETSRALERQASSSADVITAFAAVSAATLTFGTSLANLAFQGREAKAATGLLSVALRFLPFGAAVAGGLLLVKGLSAVVKGMRETAAEATRLGQIQIEAESQIAATINSTGRAARKSLADIKSLSDELQSLTGIGDEKTLRAASQLLTFTNVRGDNFDRGIKAAADVAARLGKDLEATTIQLGKALNDPIKGLSSLSESGIQFTDVQKGMIAAMVEVGDVAGAQGVILDELETQYAGAALAARDIREAIEARRSDNREAFGIAVIEKTNAALARQEQLLSDPVYKEYNSVMGSITGSIQRLGIMVDNSLHAAFLGTINLLKDFVKGVAKLDLKIRGLFSLTNANRDLKSFRLNLAPASDDIERLENYRTELKLVLAARQELIEKNFENRSDRNPFTFGVSDKQFEKMRARANELRELIASFEEGPPVISNDTGNGAGTNEGGPGTVPILDGDAERLQKTVKGYTEAAEAAEIYFNVLQTSGAEAAEIAEQRFQLQAKITQAVEGLPAAEAIIVEQAIIRESVARKTAQSYKEQLAAAEQIANQERAVAELSAAAKLERAALSVGNDRDSSVIRLTAQLLREQKEYYASMQGDAEAIARADAERIVDLQRGNEALAARNRITEEIRDKEELIKAASLGEREETIAREVIRIRREIADVSEEEARALAEQNVQLDEQLMQTREMRKAVDGLFDGLLGDASVLWDIFVRDGENAATRIDNVLGNVFDRNNIVVGINGPINSSGDGPNNGDPVSSSGTLRGTPTGRRDPSNVAYDNLLYEAINQFGPQSRAIGAANDNFISSLNNFAESFAATSPVASAALAAGRAGVSAANAIDGNGASETASSIGQLFGFVGGLLGGLFSKASSNAGAVQIDDDARVVAQFAKDKGRGDENLSKAKKFASGLEDIVSKLEDITGGQSRTLDGTIKFDDRRGITTAQRDDGHRERSFGNDVDAALDHLVDTAIDGLRGGSKELVEIAKSLAKTDLDAEQVLSSLQQIAELTSLSEEPLSKYAKAVADVSKVFDEAIDAANGAASAEKALTKSREKVLDSLRSDFTDEIVEQRRRLEGSPLAGFRSVAEGNRNLLQDDRSLFGSSSKTRGLRVDNFEKFFESLLESGTSVDELTKLLSEFKTIADDAGSSVSALQDGFRDAVSEFNSGFDENIKSDIEGFTGGPTDQLNKLLKAQKERLEQATSSGADIAQVERLTALELRDFFGGLGDKAVEEVQDYLGLFEDATNSVVRNLDLSRQDLRSRADNFESFAQSFDDLNTDFNERYVASTPRESIDVLRGRSSELLKQIADGNESAAQALPQVVSQLVENGRQTFGNSAEFKQILDFAKSINTRAADASRDVQSEAERQIAALDENNDILSDIRDILKSTEATNAIIDDIKSGGVASGDRLLQLIRDGLGLKDKPDTSNSSLTVGGILARSIAPVLSPLTDNIGTLTRQLSDLPSLQKLTIEAVNRSGENVSLSIDHLSTKVDDLEIILKKQLTELTLIKNEAA